MKKLNRLFIKGFLSGFILACVLQLAIGVSMTSNEGATNDLLFGVAKNLGEATFRGTSADDLRALVADQYPTEFQQKRNFEIVFEEGTIIVREQKSEARETGIIYEVLPDGIKGNRRAFGF